MRALVFPALALALALALAACGARSELDPPPARDGAPPDAGPPDAAPPECTADGERCAADEDCCIGRCTGGSCGACRAGDAPVILASGESTSDTYSLVADETSLYWGSLAENGSIRRIDKLGGEPLTLAAGVTDPNTLVVDRDAVYFTADNGVGSVPIAGGPATLLAGLPPSGGLPWQLAQDNAALYWTLFYVDQVMTVPKQGGAATVISTGLGGNGVGVAVDDGWIYWTSSGPDVIQRALKTGGDPIFLAADYAWSMALDDERIYYGTGCVDCGQVRALDKHGGAPEVLSEIDSPSGLALDETTVYWAWAGVHGGGVRKVSKSGGEIVDLAVAPGAFAVAVDETCVYWLDREGTLAKMHK